jgi:hypothetical protein
VTQVDDDRPDEQVEAAEPYEPPAVDEVEVTQGMTETAADVSGISF